MDINNLSEQEKLKLAACVNPDSTQDSQFSFGPEIEQMILAAMLLDRSFLTQAKNLVQSKYFANQARELICEVLFKYHDEYHSLPPKHIVTHAVREAAKARNKPDVVFVAELNTVYHYYEPQLQVREWLLDQIEEFAKVQALKLAYNKTVDIVFSGEYNKWSKIWD